MEYEIGTEKLIKQFNTELKHVTNEADFIKWLNKLKRYTTFSIRSKRKGYGAYAFRCNQYRNLNNKVATDTTKCHYRLTNRYSTGLCKWENLYKVIEVTEN